VGVLPEDSMTGTLSYAVGELSLSMSGRFISSGIYNKRYNLPGAARPDVADNTLGSVTYLNLSGNYGWQLGSGRLELQANVQNLLDKDPPLVPQQFDTALSQTVAGQTNSGLFDMLGRRYTLGLRFHY